MRLCPVVVAVLLAAPSASAAPSREIDPSQGVVDGKAAIGFWPSDSQSKQRLDPAGFEVHLVPASDLDAELVYPSGTWISPPPGRYKYWLESSGAMTPQPLVVVYSAPPFAGRGNAAVLPVAPAGKVRLAGGTALPPGSHLRLLHVDSHARGEFLNLEMSRRVRGDAAHGGVLMPAGRIVAGLHDERQGYLAITRPMTVEPGGVTTVAPAGPAAGTDVVAVLERPEAVTRVTLDDVKPILQLPGKELPPDVLVPATQRLFAFWYAVGPARSATITVRSPTVALPAREFALRSGRVETVLAELQPLPKIEARLDLAPELRAQEPVLEARVPPRPEVIARWTGPSDAEIATIGPLPRTEVEVKLTAGAWTWSERIDLSDGRDGRLLFAPRPVRVGGTVYRGERPTPAEVTFLARLSAPQREIRAAADADGRYEVVLWRVGTFVAQIRPLASRGLPFLEVVEVPDEDSVAIDFHMPSSRFLVRVVDAVSGEPIDGATVTATNESRSGPTTGQQTVTDEEGVAELQPMRPGRVVLRASAAGHLASGEHELLVEETAEASETEIALRPMGETCNLHLVLPGGGPAAGSQVRLQASLTDGIAAWQAVSDGSGAVEVPLQASPAWLLARHSTAAFAIRPWNADDCHDSLAWALQPPGPPLAIRAVHATGEPARSAPVVIAIDGKLISGPTLAWLAGSGVAYTNGEGYWEGRNFPARSLAVSIQAREAFAEGPESPAQITSVDYPWPTLLEFSVD